MCDKRATLQNLPAFEDTTYRLNQYCPLRDLHALITNHNYLAYPNMINISRNPLIDRLVAQRLPDGRPYFNHLYRQYSEAVKVPKNSLGENFEDLRSEEDFSSQEELKDYYRKEFDFTEDALLIQKLTGPKDKVPLISSFDIKILMQANRRPFFYHFPMVISRPMRLRMFGVTGMYTTDYLKKTVTQLETDKPEFIFMERLYLIGLFQINDFKVANINTFSPLEKRPNIDYHTIFNEEKVNSPTVPNYYYYMTPALMSLLEYVKDHYVFYADGKYLVAMKRKADARTDDPVIQGIRN